MLHRLMLTLPTLLLLSAGCQSSEPTAVAPGHSAAGALRAPADGNGNKLVIPIDVQFPVDCGSETLTAQFHGWIQVHVFGSQHNRNVELDVYHVEVTFTNGAGETYGWTDAGPDHFYFDGDDLVLSISGRAGSVIGHLRINLTTGEVLQVSGISQDPEQLACEALT